MTGVAIRQGTAADLPLVRPQWDVLYAHQQAHGLLADLAADGYDRWAATLGAVLGRFACLLVAESDAGPVGFLAGRVRTPTPPFAPAPVGFVSEVFVTEACRGAGVGRQLLQAAEQWFVGQGVGRLELQVLAGNAATREVYRRLGWREELVQMVYRIGSAGGGQS